MRKIVFLILVCFLYSHALSLNQIRSDLQKATVPRDSAEIKIRTTIVAPSVRNVLKNLNRLTEKNPC